MKSERIIKRAAIALSVLLGWLCPGATASEITLAWDPPTDEITGAALPDLAGYRVYFGTASRTYPATISLGNTNACQVTGLAQGATYYFAVTACDNNGIESEYSSEFVWTVADTTPPSISVMPGVALTPDPSGLIAVPDLASTAVVTDNCSPRTAIVVSQSPSAGSLIGVGATSVVLTATDESGNAATATVSVTVEAPIAVIPPDTTPPSISVAAAVRLTAGTNSTVAVPDLVQSAVVTDDGSPQAGIAVAQTPAAGTSIGIGVTSVMLTATDESGNTAQATVTVTVVGTPTLTLTSPADGTVYTLPATLTLTATAVANGHILSKVQFFNGTNLLGESGSPFSFAWTGMPAGTYTLKGRLVYDDGTVDSLPVTVVVSSLPVPWNTQDIGASIAPGRAASSNGVYTVSGAGSIGGTADSLRYVYQALSGDGEIRARVTALQNAGTGAKAGIMIRESPTGGSRQATLAWSANGQLEFICRTTTSSAVKTTLSTGFAAPGNWVRLVRKGQKITAYKSSNGSTWTSLGTQSISMATTISIGLATVSGNTSTLCTATFDNVTAVP